MQEHKVDELLVSGDLFDTRDPGAPALEMFNDFLSRADRIASKIRSPK